MATPFVTKYESNGALLARYLKLKQPDNVAQLTYIWIDGKQGLRSKTKTVHFVPKTVAELPLWNYDGSSTYQSDGDNADVYLKPVRIYNDPFRKGHNKLVLCETMTYDQKPTSTNTRHSCSFVMQRVADQVPWFGVEQEYMFLDGFDREPYGWPKNGCPEIVAPHHCGVGAGNVCGSPIANLHYKACLHAGVKLAGINVECNLSQWEFQIGPCEGVSIGDDLWMARYILCRIAEDYYVEITFDPKPLANYFGSGCHTNFSTKAMREAGGLAEIESAILKLERNHALHIANYDPSGGVDNARRLVASLVTAPIDKFSFGVGDRAASVRIPRQTADDGRGYLEDRRPSSNMDPYVVSELLVRTVCLNE